MPEYSLEIPLINKVFTAPDIKRIYELLLGRCGKPVKGGVSQLLVKIDYDRHESEKYENVEFAQILQRIQIKRVVAMSFELSIRNNSYSNNHYLRIDLTPGKSSWRNGISISSFDSSWMSRIRDDITEVFDSIKPQNRLWKNVIRSTFHSLRLLMGFTLLSLLSSFISWVGYIGSDVCDLWCTFIRQTMATKYGSITVVVFFSYFAGYPLFMFFEDKVNDALDETWPEIEFNFGPEHSRKPSKNRRLISLLASLFIIPVLLQVLFHFVFGS